MSLQMPPPELAELFDRVLLLNFTVPSLSKLKL